MKQAPELKSLKRGLRALIMLTQHRSITISGAARQLRLPRSSAERIILTLETEGFLTRDPTSKRFSLAPRVQALGGAFSAEDRMVRVATPLLFEKTKEIGWPLVIAVAQGERMSVRVTTDPATSLWLHKRHVGSEIAIAAVSGGIIHLAFSEPAEREAAIQMLARSADPAQALARDRKALDALIDAAIRDGHSIGTNEGAERALSVPLREHGRLRGVLVLIYMARAIDTSTLIERFAPEIKALAAAIEKLVFDPL
jgi:IclR family mhp operon transcriptional activator